jgi:hypothetical protein
VPRGSSSKDRHPQNGNALRYLRHRAHLTQGELTEQVAAYGHSLSAVYLSECERGTKQMSSELRAAVLAALGSNEVEYRAVRDQIAGAQDEAAPAPLTAYAERAAPASAAMPAPTPARYAASAMFGDQRYRAARSAPKPLLAARADRDESAAGLEPLSAPTHGAPPVDPEEQELVARWRRLGRSDQLTVLGVLRGLDRR